MTPSSETAPSVTGWSSSRIVRTLTGARGRPIATVLLLVIAVGYAAYGYALWRPVRNGLFDAYQQLSPRSAKRFPAVIVDIDDASLAALGRWPWPRTRLATLAETAHQLGARAVGFDIIMPEPDGLSPDVLLADRPDVPPAVREELARLPSNDAILTATLQRLPSVAARAALIDSKAPEGVAYRQTPAVVVGEPPVAYLTAYGAHLANIEAIERAASGCGYLNDTRDPDGVVRSMPLLIAVNGAPAPALSLELLRTAVGANWYRIHADRGGIRAVQIADTRIPTDTDGRIRLYFSPSHSQRYVSALAVLNGTLPPDAFANQVAIIGVTGVGTSDVAATPVAARMSGVEIQAQVLENILDGTRLVRPGHAVWLELGLFLLLAGGLIAWLPGRRPGTGVLLFAGIAAALFAASYVSFKEAHQLLDPTFPISGGGVVFVALLTAGFAASDRQRRELDLALESERLERVRMTGELAAARDIQMGMLPDPGDVQGLAGNLDFYAVLEPATEVGGDLYDAFMIDKRHFFFLVGDVAGKGVGASLFMALSKTLCKSTALRTYQPLEDLIGRVNREISRQNPAMLFVTTVAGILDARSGELQICCAGHDVPILLGADGTASPLALEAGPPLCVIEGYAYPVLRKRLTPGDLLVLISDGVTEAQNPEAVLYGKDRLMTHLNGLDPANRTAESVCRGLFSDVQNFTGGAPQSDDITILSVRYAAVSG